MRDGRFSTCPLCGAARCSTGSLRAHVASVRCLAAAQARGVTFTPEQKVLMEQALAFDRAVRAMAMAAGKVAGDAR